MLADVKNAIKELDGGKLLGELSAMPSKINLKGLEHKFYTIYDPIADKATHAFHILGDMGQWPYQFMQSVVGAIKDKFC